ncbi:hypothetical protein HMPREF1147_0119 [Selenomonas sp. FOBRC9]|nr:hypothetical protein HMPREF1147_0119 [Selenomonas sp. FOBRC9]
MHDNGISVPFFSNLPFKREVRGRKERDMGMLFHFLHEKL